MISQPLGTVFRLMIAGTPSDGDGGFRKAHVYRANRSRYVMDPQMANRIQRRAALRALALMAQPHGVEPTLMAIAPLNTQLVPVNPCGFDCICCILKSHERILMTEHYVPGP